MSALEPYLSTCSNCGGRGTFEVGQWWSHGVSDMSGRRSASRYAWCRRCNKTGLIANRPGFASRCPSCAGEKRVPCVPDGFQTCNTCEGVGWLEIPFGE